MPSIVLHRLSVPKQEGEVDNGHGEGPFDPALLDRDNQPGQSPLRLRRRARGTRREDTRCGSRDREPTQIKGLRRPGPCCSTLSTRRPPSCSANQCKLEPRMTMRVTSSLTTEQTHTGRQCKQIAGGFRPLTSLALSLRTLMGSAWVLE